MKNLETHKHTHTGTFLFTYGYVHWESMWFLLFKVSFFLGYVKSLEGRKGTTDLPAPCSIGNAYPLRHNPYTHTWDSRQGPLWRGWGGIEGIEREGDNIGRTAVSNNPWKVPEAKPPTRKQTQAGLRTPSTCVAEDCLMWPQRGKMNEFLKDMRPQARGIPWRKRGAALSWKSGGGRMGRSNVCVGEV